MPIKSSATSILGTVLLDRETARRAAHSNMESWQSVVEHLAANRKMSRDQVRELKSAERLVKFYYQQTR